MSGKEWQPQSELVHQTSPDKHLQEMQVEDTSGESTLLLLDHEYQDEVVPRYTQVYISKYLIFFAQSD